MISRELDEAQGLTVEMFRQYLQRSGWTKTNAVAGVTGYAKNRVWVCDLSLADAHNEMSQVAKVEGLSIQALLRDINPRLRKGTPSVAALEAHNGLWVAHEEDGRPQIIDGTSGGFGLPPSAIERWAWWPIDNRANKIRWPEKDGVML